MLKWHLLRGKLDLWKSRNTFKNLKKVALENSEMESESMSNSFVDTFFRLFRATLPLLRRPNPYANAVIGSARAKKVKDIHKSGPLLGSSDLFWSQNV